MNPWTWWLVDFHVLATVALGVCLCLQTALRQPARRLALARWTAGGLVVLAVALLIPAWPRFHPWPHTFRDSEIVRGSILDQPTAEHGDEARTGEMPSRSGQGTLPLDGKAGTIELDPSDSPELNGRTDDSAQTSAWFGRFLGSWFAGALVVGSLLVSFRLLVGAAQSRALLRESIAAPAAVSAVLERLGADARLPRLRLSDRIGQPMVMGLRRPTILLPQSLVGQVSDEHLQAVLAHEWAHIEHGDLWLLAWLRGLQIVLFCQPLFWLLRGRARFDQEALADAAAAGRVDPVGYAEALLHWARLGARSSPAMALALGEKPSQLKWRISMLLDPTFRVETDCPRRWQRTGWLAALGFILLLASLTVRPPAPAPAAAAEEEALALATNPDVTKTKKGEEEPVKPNEIGRKQEQAIATGIAWLVTQQAADGHWGNGDKNDLRDTALAALSLLGAGQTHKAGQPHAKLVEKILRYILSKQEKDGSFRDKAGEAGPPLGSAAAALFLCEAYGMTSDPALKGPAQRALNALLAAQLPDGGWSDKPGDPSRLNATAWSLMALKSGQIAGLVVPAKNLKSVSRFLDGVASLDGGSFGEAKPAPNGTAGLATAQGLLCRMFLGAGPRNPGLQRGMQVLAKSPPGHDQLEYAYTTTLLLHHLRAKDMDDLRFKLVSQVVAGQDKGTGKAGAKGSWAGKADADRVQATALAVITLEVYFRHRPLFRTERNDIKDENVAP